MVRNQDSIENSKHESLPRAWGGENSSGMLLAIVWVLREGASVDEAAKETG